MEFSAATQDDLELAAEAEGPDIREYPRSIDYPVSLRHEGQLLAVGGIKLLWMGTAWAWFFWFPAARAHKYTLYRVVKEWLDVQIAVHGLKRVMAAVHQDYPEGCRTVEHLGFEVEAVLPRCFGEQTGVLYRLLPGKEGA